MDFPWLSSSETDALRNSYFPDDLVHTDPICDENTHNSTVDSDSDSEVSFQSNDIIHPNINVHELALDFCDNNEIEVVPSRDENPVIVNDIPIICDPDLILIDEKFRVGCGCSRKCYSLFTEREVSTIDCLSASSISLKKNLYFLEN